MPQQQKLIIIYGPPGVGKFTVAKELAKITKFRLFHVHQLADFLCLNFKTGTKDFAAEFEDLWFALIENALNAGTPGIIATLIYGAQTYHGKDDDRFFAKIIKTAKACGAKVHFIKLTCAKVELFKRVKNPERKKFNKLTDPIILKKLIEKNKIDEKSPFAESLKIDTTKISPRKTASLIKQKLAYP